MNVEIGKEVAQFYFGDICFNFAMQPLVEKILNHVSGRRGTTLAPLLFILLVNGKLRKPW
jgi:hypothetical protein